jgi:hypothetical protein
LSGLIREDDDSRLYYDPPPGAEHRPPMNRQPACRSNVGSAAASGFLPLPCAPPTAQPYLTAS